MLQASRLDLNKKLEIRIGLMILDPTDPALFSVYSVIIALNAKSASHSFRAVIEDADTEEQLAS
eukprot:628992-Hanusia_phi.AAC.1